MSFSAEHRKIADAGKFVLFLLGFIFLFTVLLGWISSIQIEQMIAYVSSGVLNLLGIANHTGVGTDVFIQIEKGPLIIINELCTGILETVVLAAAILASFEVSWKKKAIGALAAIIAIFVFNQLRIIASILLILNAPIDVAVLSHEVLFRLFLFVAIAGFFWAWMVWSKQKHSHKTQHGKKNSLWPN